MTIDHCFGMMKARFPILKLMPPYKPSRQRLICKLQYPSEATKWFNFNRAKAFDG